MEFLELLSTVFSGVASGLKWDYDPLHFADGVDDLCV